MYVQRSGGVAARLDIGGQSHSDRVEAGHLLATPFDTQRVESKVLWGLRFACGLHHTKDTEARGHLHWS